MEEKERYEVFGKHCIKDYNPNARRQLLDAYVACVILNDQDQHIKELEEQNQRLKEQLEETKQTGSYQVMLMCQKENILLKQQLKQSQKQVAIEELEKIYNLFEPYENSQKDTILCANNGISFIDYLDNKIKKFKGE